MVGGHASFQGSVLNLKLFLSFVSFLSDVVLKALAKLNPKPVKLGGIWERGSLLLILLPRFNREGQHSIKCAATWSHQPWDGAASCQSGQQEIAC